MMGSRSQWAMTNKICSYTRSILERGIEGGYDYLDALLSSETCQMMHRGHEHFEILGLVKEKNPKFFMSMIVSNDMFDHRTISRADMRKEVNDYMTAVMQEKPLDASLMEYDDYEGW